MTAPSQRHPADALSAFARGPRNRWLRRRPLLAYAAGVFAIVAVAIALRTLRTNSPERADVTRATAPRSEGRLVVESRPSGARVEIDGLARGVTPVTLVVPAGRHVLAVTGATRRQVDVVVQAGGDVVHHVDIPDIAVTTLRVDTAPPGATVLVDGRRRGMSPLDLNDLRPGQHTVIVSSGATSVTRSVDVRPGLANSVVIALAASTGPATGWLAVAAPIDLEVYDADQLVGKGANTRTLLVAGRHEMSLVNRELGYENRRTVEIVANRTASISVQPGNGSMFLNAIPWAEVFVDGRRVGETPIANFSATLGRHDVLFRHPELGEVRRTVIVTLTAPARVGVSFEQ